MNFESVSMCFDSSIYRDAWSIYRLSNYEMNFVIDSPNSGGGTLNLCEDEATIQLPSVLCKRLRVKRLPTTLHVLGQRLSRHLMFQHHTVHQLYLTFGNTGLNLTGSQIPKQATFSFSRPDTFLLHIFLSKTTLWQKFLVPITHYPCPHSCPEESNVQTISAISIWNNSTS